MSIRIEQAAPVYSFVDKSKLAASDTPGLSVSQRTIQKSVPAETAQPAARESASASKHQPAEDAQALWGEIIVDGQSVAQIYRSGVISWDARYHQLPAHASASPSGIADQILRQIGGTLVLAGAHSLSLSL
jgi:hypothetical protein